ncbi:hypothetical protein B0H19DRAFT_1276322 [Mycena capillaripes]|nr:hypothetical protein B0H19DRAFT_1276322 [Mycena capillaripes]
MSNRLNGSRVTPRVDLNVKIQYADSLDTRFHDICSSFTGKHLFPALLRLDTVNTGPASLSMTCIELLLSPGLEHIHLSFGPSMPSVSLVLPILAERCTALTYIDIFALEEDALEVRRFLQRFSRLKSVGVWNPDYETVLHLGGLPTLESMDLRYLSVSNIPDSPPETTFALPFTGLFPSLRHLDLYKASPEFVISLLETIRNSPFESVSLDLASAPTDGVIVEKMHSALAVTCSHSSLKHLSVKARYEFHPTRTLTRDTLHPLFCFKSLRFVSLERGLRCDVDDNDILALALAWPRLEHFELWGNNERQPSVTLTALHAFSQHCPNLNFLRMNIDVTGPFPSLDFAKGAHNRTIQFFI